MSKKYLIRTLFLLTFTLNLYGVIINVLLKIIHIPGIISPLKTLTLLFLFLIVPKKGKISFSIFLLVLFAVTYLTVGIIQNRVVPTVLYLRIYFEPILFLICTNAILTNRELFLEYLKMITKHIIVFAVLGTITFLLINFSQSLDFLTKDDSYITSHWRVTFTDIIRNGVLIAGPNNAGIVQAAFLALFHLKIDEFNFLYSRRKIRSIYIVLIIGLILTFSKSAIGAYLIFVVVRKLTKMKITNVIRIGVIMVSAVLLFNLLLIYKNEYPIVKWITSIVKLEDSSSQGHISSFTEGLNTLQQNWFLGANKGSHGQKGMNFPNFDFVIESSVLTLLVDLGLVSFALYFLCLMNNIALKKNLLFYALIIGPPLLVLPIILELEPMIIFLSFIPFLNLSTETKPE
ncbi:hypothetical protein [Gaoshiqia sediminis]|uniref:Uncharacterized protein n=1 Tax=Gaoshiqia sediminis TaxID=2986998 RepID=A0AA41YA46_9BACT|nr:hypothetical protein [Gaoshiqia sediminis]MCW0484117.1 hypothetical protein [Gaoshiqia sediminis]